MNIILFELDEIAAPLPRLDARAQHILKVLRLTEGDNFDAGLVDGARGRATLEAIEKASIRLSFAWSEQPPPLDAITLIVGLPRPQTARKVLQDATSLGVGAIHFVATDSGELSYHDSGLWTNDEYRRYLIAGAQQANDTRIPRLTHDLPLPTVLDRLPTDATRLALDNYEAAESLSTASISLPTVIAIGSERGWSNAERTLLRHANFTLVHLGTRVLRTETATVAALSLVRSRLGLI